MDETQFLRLLFYVLIGGTALLLSVVTAAVSAVKYVHKLVDEKMVKHYKHEHLLGKDTTIRDRLVECKRGCPVINPIPVEGGGRNERGRYSDIRGRR